MPAFLKTILATLFSGALLFTSAFSYGVEPENLATDKTERSEINPQRLKKIILAGAGIYLGTMGALYFAWYKGHPQTSFHFHDDLHDWKQMDKGGHMVSSYHIGMLSHEAFRWAGADKRSAIWYGGAMGSVYLTSIEILDGFSAGWGSSLSDLAANSFGSAMFICQQLIWSEQRVLLKYSYRPSKFAPYRPGVLGSNHLERMLKDYNGITYWASANPHSFGLKFFPEWLNVAIGYSATGLTGASDNISGYHNGRFIPEFDRTRHFLLSFDIDLNRIETRSPTVNLLLKAIGFIKIPFPALELNSNKKVQFHPLYF